MGVVALAALVARLYFYSRTLGTCAIGQRFLRDLG